MIRLLSFALPLLVYFIGEQIWGGTIALCVSSLATIVVNVVKFLLGGHFNWKEIVTDFAFLLVFAISDIIVAHFNEAASPFVTALVLTIILAALPIIGVKRTMGTMIDNLRPGISLNQYFLTLMRGSLIRMTMWAAFATVIFFVAFLDNGSHASDWINSYALIVILLAYFATEAIIANIRKAKFKNVEWVPLITQEGKIVGSAPRPLVHNGSHWLHPVVHLHVFSSDNRLLLQLRPKTKKIQPGKWDTAVGGHISMGEKLPDALKRETYEEIGLTNFNAKLTRTYVWHCNVEDEYVFVFQTHNDGPFNTKNIGEVDSLRFWTVDELKDAIGKNILTPNIERELQEGLLDNLTSK